MKDLYMQAIAFNKATAAKEFCKNNSIFAVQNAFWSVEYFDIYKSLLSRSDSCITGLRKFKSAYLPSVLKNPTYSELRAHMKSPYKLLYVLDISLTFTSLRLQKNMTTDL
ncbi:hypothetical protein BJV82DRAFT_579932 [Fennellomyces sp. T-0311]|nr:hypothetical protein BJV82DRAFT_579932 [Fennellomyces sp. T-0311]